MNGKVFEVLERLRNRLHDAPMPSEYLMDDAADTIASLTAENERLRAALAAMLAEAKINGRVSQATYRTSRTALQSSEDKS